MTRMPASTANIDRRPPRERSIPGTSAATDLPDRARPESVTYRTLHDRSVDSVKEPDARVAECPRTRRSGPRSRGDDTSASEIARADHGGIRPDGGPIGPPPRLGVLTSA